jgi:hypothetical protein
MLNITRDNGAARRSLNVRFRPRLCGNSQPSPPDEESSLLEFFSESKSLCRGRYAEFVTMEESSARVFTQPRPIADIRSRR